MSLLALLKGSMVAIEVE